MEDVTHAVQFEPGRWRVYVNRDDFRQVMIMTSPEFSRLLAGEPYKADVTFTEWEDDPDHDGPKVLDG